MLIVDGMAYIATWALLLWAKGVPLMKLMQVTFGLATAGEIGYYSYLYAKVTSEHYKKVASFTRAATLLGKFVAYLMGQLFVSFEVMTFFHLNIISFASVCVAFIIAVFLPKADYSEIFHQYIEHTEEAGKDKIEQYVKSNNSVNTDKITDTKPYRRTICSGLLFLATELKHIYSTRTVILWSVWWALASCGNFQVGNYIQNLWKIVAPHKESRKLYNGAVEAGGTLFSKYGYNVAICINFLLLETHKQVLW